jgi:hypothetical protein
VRRPSTQARPGSYCPYGRPSPSHTRCFIDSTVLKCFEYGRPRSGGGCSCVNLARGFSQIADGSTRGDRCPSKARKRAIAITGLLVRNGRRDARSSGVTVVVDLDATQARSLSDSFGRDIPEQTPLHLRASCVLSIFRPSCDGDISQPLCMRTCTAAVRIFMF